MLCTFQSTKQKFKKICVKLMRICVGNPAHKQDSKLERKRSMGERTKIETLSSVLRQQFSKVLLLFDNQVTQREDKRKHK